MRCHQATAEAHYEKPFPAREWLCGLTRSGASNRSGLRSNICKFHSVICLILIWSCAAFLITTVTLDALQRLRAYIREIPPQSLTASSLFFGKNQPAPQPRRKALESSSNPRDRIRQRRSSAKVRALTSAPSFFQMLSSPVNYQYWPLLENQMQALICHFCLIRFGARLAQNPQKMRQA